MTEAPQPFRGSLAEAFVACEAITANEAKNFSYGIRLLPPDKRGAMSALYALARRIDDIGDGPMAVADKVAALTEVRKAVADVAAGVAPPDDDPVLIAMADSFRRYPLEVAAVDDLIDGCEMDCAGANYATIDELVVYCRRVAGSVGRLSLAIFGAADLSAGEPLADALGVALQLTNILRDIVEDREVMGRVYLPSDDLSRFGCASDASGPTDAMVGVVLFEAVRARGWYEEGLGLLPMLDRRSRACVGAMAGIYQRLLGRIQRHPQAVLSGRVSVPAWEKAWVAARSLSGVGFGGAARPGGSR